VNSAEKTIAAPQTIHPPISEKDYFFGQIFFSIKNGALWLGDKSWHIVCFVLNQLIANLFEHASFQYIRMRILFKMAKDLLQGAPQLQLAALST
jgi:hypothetical protein